MLLGGCSPVFVLFVSSGKFPGLHKVLGLQVFICGCSSVFVFLVWDGSQGLHKVFDLIFSNVWAGRCVVCLSGVKYCLIG